MKNYANLVFLLFIGFSHSVVARPPLCAVTLEPVNVIDSLLVHHQRGELGFGFTQLRDKIIERNNVSKELAEIEAILAEPLVRLEPLIQKDGKLSVADQHRNIYSKMSGLVRSLVSYGHRDALATLIRITHSATQKILERNYDSNLIVQQNLNLIFEQVKKQKESTSELMLLKQAALDFLAQEIESPSKFRIQDFFYTLVILESRPEALVPFIQLLGTSEAGYASHVVFMNNLSRLNRAYKTKLALYMNQYLNRLTPNSIEARTIRQVARFTTDTDIRRLILIGQ